MRCGVQVDVNFYSQMIDREEFQQLRRAFAEIDTSGDGMIDLQELADWCVVSHLRDRRASPTASKRGTCQLTNRALERIRFRAQKVAEKARGLFDRSGIIEACSFEQVRGPGGCWWAVSVAGCGWGRGCCGAPPNGQTWH